MSCKVEVCGKLASEVKWYFQLRGRGSVCDATETVAEHRHELCEELEKARDYFLDKEAWTRMAFSFNTEG
jgi:hypothetical protein